MAYANQIGEEPEQPFHGSYSNGVLVWTRETPSGRHLIRTWIASNVLHHEETFFSRTHPDEGYLVSSLLKRAGEHRN